VFLTEDIRDASTLGGPPIPAWASWERIADVPLQPGGSVTPAGLGLLASFPGFLGQIDPQDLLTLLQSATGVREAGPASGSGVRVRRLDALDRSFGATVSQVEISFGGFGRPVSVSPPPASVTWTPPGS
jgi:hypothetical protein